MTLPIYPSSISLQQINNEFGRGTNLNSYRGTTWYTDTYGESGTFPSTNLSFSNFYGKRATSPSPPYRYRQLTVGSLGTGLLMGANTTSGGDASWSLTYSINDDIISSYTYEVGQVGYYVAINTTNNLANVYFPLVPTIYGWNGFQWIQHRYCLGTCLIPGSFTQSTVPIYVFRSFDTNWTDSAVKNFLGLTSTQLTKVISAERVWYNQTYTGVDSTIYYGLATCTYAGGVTYQSIWDNKTVKECYLNNDVAQEWANHGFNYSPTVSITGGGTGYTVTNTGTSAFTMTGATFRDAGGPIGNLSDYTVTLGPNDLVIPIVKTDRGFSGGAFNGTRDPLQVSMSYIQKYI